MASKIFVITGTSRVGKGALVKELLRRVPELKQIILATTRARRRDEVDDRDYHFIDEEEFKRRLSEGEILGFSTVYGGFRGILRSEIENRLSEGIPAILEIDVGSAREIWKTFPDSTPIFISPPNAAELLEGLEPSRPQMPFAKQAELNTAQFELKARDTFSYQVINDSFDRASAELEQIVRRELGAA